MKRANLVYLFTEGKATMKALLGGKGANLAEMTNIGLPVPPGLTITTEACRAYFEQEKELPRELEAELWLKLAEVERETGKKLGDPVQPLLLSVRSGAPVSMPGMMDTILNLGLNEVTVAGLVKATNNERFVLDCYRRFIQMFADVVMEIEHNCFEAALGKLKKEVGVKDDQDLTARDLTKLVKIYKTIVREKAGREFPTEPREQLIMAIKAVFDSWYNPRAEVYRKAHHISRDLGTAVNVQVMVFGNIGDNSGTGVAFTRNPATGEKKIYGEYLLNAQGEDVVAGIRTPLPLSDLEDEMPEIYAEFQRNCEILEQHYRDVQDIEFTIEAGQLYLLQTRSGKRTAPAAIKIAVDMHEEGLITKEEALLRVEPASLSQLLHKQIDSDAEVEVIARGLPASPGAAVGKIVLTADQAQEMAEKGEQVILVSTETTPDDIHGIIAAQGILTSRGGMTSHAAVVARGMGKCCVCGCESVKIDFAAGQIKIKDLVLREGDLLSLEGSAGEVILGAAPLKDPVISPEFEKLLKWADQTRKLKIRTNADNPTDVAKAREFGAEGIGLCRTEHMFMASERLPLVQKMILADSVEERKAALAQLLPIQEEDFYGILKAMQGFPVTIRFLDPPLHEFLPDLEELVLEIAEMKYAGTALPKITEKEKVLAKVRDLHEFNPMLGHRGCRLGITYPEIYRMQARAILQAAARLIKEGYLIIPEIEIPLIMHKNELVFLRREVEEIAQEVMAAFKVNFEYFIGTMIELPRACLTAADIAEAADFFSFGTNDLTQTTFGFSRDDAEGKFLTPYLEKEMLTENPFVTIDRAGVGQLMQLAVEKGRQEKEDLLIGICGEHGGDPNSVEFCHLIGLDYVSCSPFRVPIARLAAAQAAINFER